LIFQRHNHPFIFVSTLAMRSGGNNLLQKEIDMLVRSSHLQALVDGLVESGKWEVSKNYADIEGEMNHRSLAKSLLFGPRFRLPSILARGAVQPL
jgi:hypothetical protein